MKKPWILGLLAIVLLSSVIVSYMAFMGDGRDGSGDDLAAGRGTVGTTRKPVSAEPIRTVAVADESPIEPVKGVTEHTGTEPVPVPVSESPSKRPNPPGKAPVTPQSEEPVTGVQPFIKAVEGGVAVYTGDPAQGGRLYLKRAIPMSLLTPVDKERFEKGFPVKDGQEALGILESLGSMAD